MIETTAYSRAHGAGPSERNDCAVRAISLALNRPYKDVHETLGALGRKRGRGTKRRAIWDALNILQGLLPSAIPKGDARYLLPTAIAPTVAQFLRDRPRGRYVCLVRGHAFAVIDGVVHDWDTLAPKMRRRVNGYYQATP